MFGVSVARATTPDNHLVEGVVVLLINFCVISQHVVAERMKFGEFHPQVGEFQQVLYAQTVRVLLLLDDRVQHLHHNLCSWVNKREKEEYYTFILKRTFSFFKVPHIFQGFQVVLSLHHNLCSWAKERKRSLIILRVFVKKNLQFPKRKQRLTSPSVLGSTFE